MMSGKIDVEANRKAAVLEHFQQLLESHGQGRRALRHDDIIFLQGEAECSACKRMMSS